MSPCPWYIYFPFFEKWENLSQMMVKMSDFLPTTNDQASVHQMMRKKLVFLKTLLGLDHLLYCWSHLYFVDWPCLLKKGPISSVAAAAHGIRTAGPHIYLIVRIIVPRKKCTISGRFYLGKIYLSKFTRLFQKNRVG